VQQLEGSEDFDIHLDTPASLPDLNAAVARTIFVIVQEAVNNARNMPARTTCGCVCHPKGTGSSWSLKTMAKV